MSLPVGIGFVRLEPCNFRGVSTSEVVRPQRHLEARSNHSSQAPESPVVAAAAATFLLT